MVHKTALCLTFRLAPADLLTAPEGWKIYIFSTLGKKWAQTTYIDPLYAPDMQPELGRLKIARAAESPLTSSVAVRQIEDCGETVSGPNWVLFWTDTYM